LVAFRIGERLHKYAIDDAVNRCVGADADGECEEHGAGEARRLSQSAKGELQVGKNRLKPGPLPDLAALFREKGQVPKGAKGRLSSFGTRKIFKAHQLLSFLFDVLMQFLGQLVTKLSATEDSL
jgi:hypothetical protein